MSPAFYPTYFIIFLVLLMIAIETKRQSIQRIIKRKKNRRGNKCMNEIIKEYVSKDCIIFLSNSSTVIKGNVTSLNDNWITVKTKDGNESINIDYIVRIKEHPVNKNGKKKSVFA